MICCRRGSRWRWVSLAFFFVYGGEVISSILFFWEASVRRLQVLGDAAGCTDTCTSTGQVSRLCKKPISDVSEYR